MCWALYLSVNATHCQLLKNAIRWPFPTNMMSLCAPLTINHSVLKLWNPPDCFILSCSGLPYTHSFFQTPLPFCRALPWNFLSSPSYKGPEGFLSAGGKGWKEAGGWGLSLNCPVQNKYLQVSRSPEWLQLFLLLRWWHSEGFKFPHLNFYLLSSFQGGAPVRGHFCRQMHHLPSRTPGAFWNWI